MKLNTLTKTLSKGVGRTKFFIKKHAPEILMVTGTVSILTGTVAACKSTIKAADVLAELNAELEPVRELHEKVISGEVEEKAYPDIAYRKELANNYFKYGFKMAKLYAPAVILTGLGIASIFASNNILRKRCASLSAAYVTLDNMFKSYRKNVVEKYGEDVDREMRYGLKKNTITVEETDEETGKKKKVKKDVTIDDTLVPSGYSDYARFWDRDCDGFCEDENGRPNTDCNLFYLRAREKEANYRLRKDGYLFLNDVYKMLGIEPSIAGQSVGWIYDNKREESDQEGDGFISFGIFKGTRANARFIEGIEDVILLDFNVDGPILDRLNGTLARV